MTTNPKQNNQTVEHEWKSSWDSNLGQYLCKSCGLTPQECKGYITIRRER